MLKRPSIPTTHAVSHTARAGSASRSSRRAGEVLVRAIVIPAWSKAVKWVAWEAASSSTRGGGWAPSGPASPWE
eukprot:scaffold66475_cov63-Phaeocystis_antarctica.AAC.1